MTRRPDADWTAERARYYDLDMVDLFDDLPMYQELASRTDGPILELAAGSGRIAIPLALAGRTVVGIDDDEAMLERGRSAWRERRGTREAGELELIEADMTAFRSDTEFGYVLLAINTMLLMPDDESRMAVLVTARANMRTGGLFVADMLDPYAEEVASYDGRLHLEWLRDDPETGEQVSKLISGRHDPDTETVVLTQLFDATPAGGGPVRRLARQDTLYLADAGHWRNLALEAGFGEVEIMGDHLLTPHGAGSHRVILVARLV